MTNEEGSVSGDPQAPHSIEGEYVNLGAGIALRRDRWATANTLKEHLHAGARFDLSVSVESSSTLHPPDGDLSSVDGGIAYAKILSKEGFKFSKDVWLDVGSFVLTGDDASVITLHVKPHRNTKARLGDRRVKTDPLVALIDMTQNDISVHIKNADDNLVLLGSDEHHAKKEEPQSEDTVTQRVAREQVAISQLCEDFRKNNDPENDLQLDLFIHLLEAVLKRLRQIQEGIGGDALDSALIEAVGNEGQRVLTIEDAFDVGENVLRTGERGLSFLQRSQRLAEDFISWVGGGPGVPPDSGA